MAVIELTGAVGVIAPRRRRGRAALSRLGSGIAVLIPIVVLSSFITYCLGALSNSNPAATILGQDAATPAAVAHLDKVLGLDKPLVVQYWDWLTQALHGNLGVSYFTQIPVSQSIAQRLPVDLSIAITAVILAVLIGGTAGTLAAVYRGSWFDRGVTVACSVVSTLPAFVVGIILVVLFAVAAHLLPAEGYVGPTAGIWPWFEHIILPSLALALQVAADIARQLRTSLVSVLDQNYITGARVRGLPYRRILFRHALRNAAGPALTVLGVQVPMIIGGAVVAEKMFALPGVAQLALTAGSERDVPVIQGALLVTVGVVLVSNIVVNAVLLRLTPQGRRGSRTVRRRPVLQAAGGAA